MCPRPESVPAQNAASGSPQLLRGMGLGGAIAINMIDMIGVGPLITLPLIVAAMGGPQAMLGWIVGAILALCDGLVWAELGAAMPQAGGSYYFLKEIYGANKLGRLVSFLFIWQLSFSAPLSIASGCIGLGQYAGYLWPSLRSNLAQGNFHVPVPLIGRIEAHTTVSPGTFVAISAVVLAVFLLYRNIATISRLSKFLWAGVIVTIGWIIFAGITHFNAARAFSFPPGAFHLSGEFFTGLGAAMLIATYDYWGYYNVCFLGGEVKDPARNIPRTILWSIAAVAFIYILMNISVLGVMPWQELKDTAGTDTHFVISVFMQRLYGHWAGVLVTLLIMWTAFGSVFSLLLGYSRVPYAAALDGNYFSVFARVHPRHRFPYVSLLALGAVAIAFCFLSLADVIAALVVIRILLQFLLQQVGVIVLRRRRPDLARPFRMWLYPLPVLFASLGFIYILVARSNFMREIRYAAVLLVLGIAVYLIRAASRGEWPLQKKA
ncbi:MAG: APC family permease [Acidobacteriia bacterium]|nr:APC family permease [Terriglobia bacterium]